MISLARLASFTSLALAAAAVPNAPRQNNLPPPFNGTHTGDGELSAQYPL